MQIKAIIICSFLMELELEKGRRLSISLYIAYGQCVLKICIITDTVLKPIKWK